MQPLVDTPHEFSEYLHAYLTWEQMQAVVERNRAETALGACHSHDFYDQFCALRGLPVARHGLAAEVGMALYGVLWDQAWNLAKERDFHIAG
ncbi:MAG: hypothetical protein I8H71_05295 [Xanthomonadaceae bacterium]|nr:hypothetical protein [Xanthomonadaceae bacterium]